MITHKLDPSTNGPMIRWVEALAARLDHLDVICRSASPPLPANVTVYSMGRIGAGRIAQAARLTGHLRRLVPGADGVFCHMIPRYVIFAAPWTRRHGKPLLHWYTHRQVSPELRLARRLATRILTAAPGSYPLPSAKVVVMGHGIEADLFPPARVRPPRRMLMIGGCRASSARTGCCALRRKRWRAARPAFRVALVGGVEHEPDVLPRCTGWLNRSIPRRRPLTGRCRTAASPS